ncbi:unnamed protein product [Brassica napus]|uniref:(rape) hypothetical protein n=1 Tax=Brassica napus TaxID=3708 RepID=A0A816IPN8_BRANA|nr:unnamed protein product [Brassica napus]
MVRFIAKLGSIYVSSYLKPDPGLHQRSWPRNNPLTSRNVATCCTVLDKLDPPRASVCACNAARITFLGRLGINVRVDELLRLCRRPTTPGFRCSLTQMLLLLVGLIGVLTVLCPDGEYSLNYVTGSRLGLIDVSCLEGEYSLNDGMN